MRDYQLLQEKIRPGGEERQGAEPSPGRQQETEGQEREGEEEEDGREEFPVTVCLRLKPNPENLPAALRANQSRGTVSFEPEPEGQAEAEAEAEVEAEAEAEAKDTAREEHKFEYVFTESASQETVFAKAVQQFVESVLLGFDFTLVCCGQTGSGKTHSLFGPALPMAMNEADFGVAPR